MAPSKKGRTDRQRRKVYDAERVITWDMVTKAQARSMLKRLSAKFGILVPGVQFTTGGGGIYRPARGLISLPKGYIPTAVVTHEFAHHLAACEREVQHGHDGAFASAHIRVVEAHLGVEAAMALTVSYLEAGVSINADDYRAKTRALRAS